jgi:predicted PurR-regulated permease PerM
VASTAQGRRVEAIAGLAALVFVAVGCFIVLRPFLTSLAWALILVFVTWPLFLRIEDLVGGRTTLAAALMTLILAVALLIPMFMVGSGLTDSAIRAADQVQRLVSSGLPEPPGWLADVPLFGPDLAERWHGIDDAQIAETVRGFIRPVSQWALRLGARVGSGLVELTLSVVAAFFFFRDGVAASKRMAAFIERLAGNRAQRLMSVAENTTKGVVYGVIGTALAQATLAAIGLWIAGIPAWLFLGFITFFVSIVPPGAPLVWLPATAWLVYNDEVGWAIFLGVWGFFVVSGIDNFLKPYFISRGSAMPLLLVLLGVFGGALAFGFLGVFLGPIFLAVGYTLLKEWSSLEIRQDTSDAAPAPPAGPPSAAPQDEGSARSGV